MTSTMGGQHSTQADSDRIQYPLRLMLPRIGDFIKVFRIDLERLQQHKANIIKFQTLGDWSQLNKEHINASHTVQKLKSNIQQLEQLRLQVKDADQEKFSAKLDPIQQQTQKSLADFLTMHKQLDLDSDLSSWSKDTGPEVEENAEPGESSTSLPDEQLQVQLLSPEAEQSWANLEGSVIELNSLMVDFANLVHTQHESIDTIEDNVTTAQHNVREGTTNLAQSLKLKAAMFPVMGAVIGGAVGGPVGFVAGIKLGALAAVGGGIAGFTGGRFLKKHQEKSVDNEMCELHKSEGPSTSDSSAAHSC